jgi:hypothetical protein
MFQERGRTYDGNRQSVTTVTKFTAIFTEPPHGACISVADGVEFDMAQISPDRANPTLASRPSGLVIARTADSASPSKSR